jgi:hypothetical protein
MYDHGSNLRAQAGALEELLFERSDEITELVDVFMESGLTIGNRWHKLRDAHLAFFESPQFEGRDQRSMQPGLTDTQKQALATEYEELMQSYIRHYVEMLEPELTREMKDAA